MAYKVYLSPEDRSTNTYHPAALYNGHTTNEHEQMCRCADLLEAALQRCGFAVKNDQETGKGAVYRRVRRANDWPADLYIALHTNGFDGTVQGTRIHCYPSAKSRKIAKLILERIAPLSPGTRGERVVESRNLIELRSPVAPAVLPEFEFHDNAESAKWLVANMPLIAEETCKAVCEYFGVAYVPAEPVTPEPTPTPSPAEKTVPMAVRMLQKGMQGEDVKTLQAALNARGYSCGAADGIFGAGTEKALKAFQTVYELGADGIAGKGTWGKMLGK